MISCRILGPVDVTVDGAAAPPELLWRKNLALLIYLARSPARRRTRQHLIGLLWGDKTESAARHSLREAMRVLRRSVGEDGVTTDGDQIRLGEGVVELDTDRFDRLAAAADWAGAAALVVGEFLEGFSVPDASPFEDWLLAERTQWQRRAVEALTQHAEARLAAGDVSAAAALADRASALDPASARALRAAMRALALSGDRAAALERFARFTAADAETAALADRIRHGREWQLPDYARAAAGRGAESRRPPLTGRERELAAVLEHWRRVRGERRCAMVVLEADPGLGKTRLAEEVVARVTLDGGAVAAVRAVPADLAQPFSGAFGLARGGLLEAPGVTGAHQAALAALAGQVTEWAERFPKAARGTAPWPLAAAFGEILRAAGGEQPLLLVLDDAQWLDDDTYLVLEALARDLAAAPILLLIAAAPQPLNAKLAELRARIGRDVAGVTLRLQPLDLETLRPLARWALPKYSEVEVDRVARRVGADSAGLPLLAVELYHAIALGMDLKASAGAWPEPMKTLDQTLPGDLPDTITAAIRVGFRRLSAPAQQALTAAAVLGERVDAATIARATQLKADTLHGALDELEWQRWLVAEPRGYSFVARIVGDVVRRDMITPGQRQRMLDAATTTP